MKRLVLVFALLVAALSPADPAGFCCASPAGVVVAYRGNPNLTASGSITGAIALSRSSCQTPCFVQASASAITVTATRADGSTAVPYEDGSFDWNCGGQQGVDTVTPTIIGLKDLNSDQHDGDILCKFSTAGTKTITLTARFCSSGNCAGTPTYISSTITATVTVTTFTPTTTLYFNNNLGNNSWDGTAPTFVSGMTGPKQSLDFSFTNQAQNTQYLLAQGNTFTTAAFSGNVVVIHPNISTAWSGIRFGTYNDGSSGTTPPIVRTTLSGQPALEIDYGPSHAPAISDIVITGITFTNASASDIDLGFVSTGTSGGSVTDVCFDSVTFNQTLDVDNVQGVHIAGSGVDHISNICFWKTTITGLTAPSAGTRTDGMLTDIDSWFSFVGGNVSGNTGSGDLLRLHHIYNHTTTHTNEEWNTFGAGANRNLTLKNSHDQTDSTPNVFYGQFYSIHENYLSGTQIAHDMGCNNNDPTLARMKNYIARGNVYFGYSINNQVTAACGETLTVSDALICITGGIWMDLSPFSGSTDFVGAQLYRNKGFTSGTGTMVNWTGFTWTKPHTDSDSTYYSSNAAASLKNMVFTDQVSAGSKEFRGKYYFPNSTFGLANNSSNVSFATWQANGWDTAGSVANPGWSNPAACVF